MARTRFGVLALGVLVVLASTIASAHHSFAAAYDINQPLTMTGTLTEMRLQNPHSWFFITIKGADGGDEKWAFEGSTPTSLIRSGFSAKSVTIGEQVTIKGYRARDLSQNAGAARELVLADGRAFAVGPIAGAGGR